jgi:hypothetical protein
MYSTASIIKTELLKQGISIKKIRAQHLRNLYTALNKTAGSPDDFSFLNKIFPSYIDINSDHSHPCWGVIIETRAHPALELVIHNIIKTTSIPVQLFHGEQNIGFIMSTQIADWVRDKKVHLTQLHINKLDAKKYNALLLSKVFWENVIGRNKILIFQTDSILCSNSEYKLNDFIDYDYIGSKWSRHRPIGIIVDGGNGGLSLRDWQKSYDCLNLFPRIWWTGGEDGYFAFHIELIGGKVGQSEKCAEFSTQISFEAKSFGCHKIIQLSVSDKAKFLQYCPEADFLLQQSR